MPFKKGEKRPKSAGRKKGSTNKGPAALKLKEQLGATGLCLASEVKALLDDPATTPLQRFEIIKWLTEWTQKKPRPDDDGLDDLSDLDLDEAENNVVTFGGRR